MLEAKCDECLLHPNIFLQLRVAVTVESSESVNTVEVRRRDTRL